MLPVAARVAARAHARLVFDRAPDEGRVPRRARSLRRERALLRACSAVLTATETDAAALQERQRLPACPLTCREIEDQPAPSHTPANLRRRLQLGSAPLALFRGEEPPSELSTGMIGALSGCPGVHLAVLGADGWRCADALALEAERLRCAGRLHLLRAIPRRRVPAYASEADVGLCLSNGSDASALASLYEFASARLPVIVSAASECERVVRRFDFGWIAESTDAQQLSAALELACRSERGARRRNAARAAAGLTWQTEAQVVVGLYQRIASSDDRVLPGRPKRLSLMRRNAVAITRELRTRRGERTRTRPRAFMHLALGRNLRSHGEYARAVTHFEQALRLMPDDASAAEQRAATLKDAGHRAEAIEAFKGLLAPHGELQSTGVAVNAAINLARLGVRSEPEQVMSRLWLEAASAREWSRGAELAVALGDVAGAGEAIARAIELSPDDRATRRIEVRVLEQAGEPAAALASAVQCRDQVAVARLEGQLRLFDPRWLPAGPAPLTFEPVPDCVLHLLETSLPHATTGYSYRTRTVLCAQGMAGLAPVAATRLGFPASRGVREFAHTEVVEGVVHHRFTLPGVQRYTSVPLDQQLARNVELLAGLLESTRPAVLHATTPHHNGLLGLSLREAFGVPLLYEVRGFPEMTWAVRRGGERASVYRLRRAAETRCMLEADGVVTLSEVMRAHVISRGVPAERVWVVPHMIDVEAIKPTRRSPDLVRRYGLEDRVIVGYLGTLVDYEGLDVLLRALARLQGHRPPVVGLIVGGGPAEPALRALADELGLDRSVIFAGRVSHTEVNDHVALFDVYAIPRHPTDVCRFVTPLKPYEAMAAASCLLTSDVEALAETVTGGTGLTFPAGDAVALAETLATLASDPDRRHELGARGREKVLSEHDQQSVATVAAAPVRAAVETREVMSA